MNQKLLIEKLYDDVILPIRITSESAGMDLSVHRIKKIYSKSESVLGIIEVCSEFTDTKNCIIKPGERVLIGTGLKATVKIGYEIQIRPRSGLALKQGLTVLNTPGTIDSDYRGEIGVIIINNSSVDRFINFGDRIAQMVVQKVELLDIEVVDKLPDNLERGEGGFGHTGV